MKDNLKIVALIPARCGSKGIIHKNIKLYKGIPLIGHSIEIGLQCSYINDVYVSTDSKLYQDIAVSLGAQVTPLRPSEISNDLSPDIDVFKFFIKMFVDRNEKIPDIIIHLRPTYPNRKIEVLNDCIKMFLENYDFYDSLRTVIPFKKTPYKMYHILDNNLIPVIEKYNNLVEHFNQGRQYFPETYLHNGYIDIVKTKIIINDNLLSGSRILPYIMSENDIDDIDDLTDFHKSENK